MAALFHASVRRRLLLWKRWPLAHSLARSLIRSLGVRHPHAVVSSDASLDRLQTQESTKDKLIIYRHYATDDQRGVTVQKQLSTLETACCSADFIICRLLFCPPPNQKIKIKMKETSCHFGTLHEQQKDAKMTPEINKWRNPCKHKPWRQLIS